MQLDTARPKHVFDELTISATMAPGSMMILTALPIARQPFGHYFFTKSSGTHLEQKLLLLRLCQTQHDDLVTPPALPLGE